MDFDEYTLQPGQEATDRWMHMRVGDYIANTTAILDILKGGGDENVLERLDRTHKELVHEVLDKVTRSSKNAFEQAAVTSMVGTTLLATFNGQIDYINFQMDMLDLEEGM